MKITFKKKGIETRSYEVEVIGSGNGGVTAKDKDGNKYFIKNTGEVYDFVQTSPTKDLNEEKYPAKFIIGYAEKLK